MAISYPLLFLFSFFSLTLSPSSCTLRALGVYGQMGIWVWFVYVRMLYDVCGYFVVRVCVLCCPFGALLHNNIGFFTDAVVAEEVWDAWARNILVCHTFVSLWSVAVGVRSLLVCVWWCFVLSLFLVLCLSLCFVYLFLSTRTSRLAPMARTLLGVLEQATLKFFVVATRLFLVFCVCPKFWRPSQTAAEISSGASEVAKMIFHIFLLPVRLFFVSISPAAIARDSIQPPHK